jgi:hypothetical protein
MNDRTKPPPEQSPRWYAEQYAALLRWRVLPLHTVIDGICTCPKGKQCGNHAGKHPRTRHGHQDGTTDPKRIKLWKWETANVGIATGLESNLLVLDIDPRNGGAENLQRLIAELGELPPSPKVGTGSDGEHRYFRHPGCEVNLTVFDSLGINLKGRDGLVVAPPSIHFSGNRYRWQVSPRKVPPPELPVKWLQRISVTQRAQRTQEVSENPEVSKRVCVGLPPATDGALDCYIRGVIHRTLPEHPGTRHKMLFQLARLLQGNSEVAGWSAQRLRLVVNDWFAEAQRKVGSDAIKATADENWFDFVDSWGRVRFPGEGGLMTALLENAKAADMPACAMQYETEEVRLIIKLCRELQRHAGDAPFFLSVSMVNDLILKAGENRMRGWRILRGLVFDGVLEVVEKGTATKRQASSFRYRGD